MKQSFISLQRDADDDLLGGGGGDTATATATATESGRSKEDIEKDIAELNAKIKDLRLEKKGQKPKSEKVTKGVMVAFRNKKGETITGKGVEYYVARHGGKLHYKEASQVIFLKDDWKEGDEIIGKNGETLPELAPAK